MIHVALVFGGPSPEHDVSLVSAKNIYEVLSDTEFHISLIGITRTGVWKLIDAEALVTTNFQTPLDLNQTGVPIRLALNEDKIWIVSQTEGFQPLPSLDIAFPIIHGPYGEDGRLQKELEAFKLPYVGSQPRSCMNSFDKAKTKEIIKQINIPQVNYLVTDKLELNFEDIEKKLGKPFFIKPANMGSSVGISKASNQEELSIGLKHAAELDKKIVIEKGVIARELECAVLEIDGKTEVSCLGEVKPLHDFYSYEAKYLDPNGAELIIPAIVDKEISEQIRIMAKNCFEALDCRDYARADFFLTTDGDIYFNEINTHPGFTNISQFPMLWKEMGMEYKELILHMIKQALNRP